MSGVVRLQVPSLLNNQNLFVNSRDAKYLTLIIDPNADLVINDIRIMPASGNPSPLYRVKIGNGINKIYDNLTMRSDKHAAIVEPFINENMSAYLELQFNNSDNIQPDENGRQIIKTRHACRVTLLWETTSSLFINDTEYAASPNVDSIVVIPIGNGITPLLYDIDITGSSKIGYIIETLRPA